MHLPSIKPEGGDAADRQRDSPERQTVGISKSGIQSARAEKTVDPKEEVGLEGSKIVILKNLLEDGSGL